MGHVVACDQRRIHAGGDGRENNHIATSVAPADQGTVFRIGQDVSDAAGERRVFLPDRIGVRENYAATYCIWNRFFSLAATASSVLRGVHVKDPAESIVVTINRLQLPSEAMH